MLRNKTKRGYSLQRKYVQGKGFVDTLQNIGSYVSQNRDLIAKPLIGAVGDLTAFGLTQGGKALLTKIMNKTRNKNSDENLNPKAVEILRNITGSGIKQF
jgi:hypothetical protein